MLPVSSNDTSTFSGSDDRVRLKTRFPCPSPIKSPSIYLSPFKRLRFPLLNHMLNNDALAAFVANNALIFEPPGNTFRAPQCGTHFAGDLLGSGNGWPRTQTGLS